MIEEAHREVIQQHRTAHDKYTYFILAAAASGIALAVNSTAGALLSYWQVPLGLAVLSWGASFYAGCRHLQYVSSALYANAVLLEVKQGLHPEVGSHPDLMRAASEGILSALGHNSEEAVKLGTWQFRLLVTGALFYLAWHVLGMFQRTIGTP